jgi:hypothetical protein
MTPRFGPSPEAVLGDVQLHGSAAICIPDATRPLDPSPALTALRPHIGGDARVFVGLGLHRRMTDAERTRLAAWSPTEHDPDDCLSTAIVDGIEGGVFAPVARCDRAIGIGVVELHQYAGVSGGHKAVSVGCGSRSTISALHHRDRVTAPGVLVGRVDGNPFRAVVDALGEAAGCTHALVWIPSRGEWGFGPPRSLIRAAAGRLAPWYAVPQCYDSVLLDIPNAKASSLYQASRAATYLALSPSPPLRPGSRLRLHARLPEGLGAEAGFCRALAESKPPWSSLLTGPPPRGAGAQRAVMLALLARHYRLEVWGCDNPSPFLAVGIPASSEPPPRDPHQLIVPHPFATLPQLAVPPVAHGV